MLTIKKLEENAAFTLVEMIFSILIIGVLFIALASIFILFQRSSAATGDYTDAQQNARVAVDFITDLLRQAGSEIDYTRGQRAIVHAGPYQIVFNADLDNGKTIDGLAPLSAINPAFEPKTVPPSGTILYTPERFQSDAETVVLTLDSNSDGVITGADRGDDPEETGPNRNLFMLKRVIYGYNGSGQNEIRTSNLALVRGPNLFPTWNTPEPLFQYWYDHDDNPSTPDRLWGDSNNNGAIDGAEIGAITPVTNANLHRIRKVRTAAIAESNRYDKRYETNGGFLSVSMSSEVYARNIAARSNGNICGRVFHDSNSNGVIDFGETGLYNVEVRIAGTSRSTRTDNFGNFYMSLQPGDYSVQEIDPPGFVSVTPNLISISLAAGQVRVVNFADRSTLPRGVIRGTVFEDLNKDGILSSDELGLENVLISLDDGSQTYTNSLGRYSFVVQIGTYQVIKSDPVGYTSTTPNTMTATVANDGDTVTVDFGNFSGDVTGMLHGYVFLDANEDGLRNSGEEGIPNVVLHVSNGDSTTTNATGYYKINLPPGTYSITEEDPRGYTSTTVNTYSNILISPDTLVTRNFGDILVVQSDFVEIHISNTNRVLSVVTADLHEDALRDQDIVLGTALATGFGNMLVFHNMRESATTPIAELFESQPTYRRDAGQNINSLSQCDISGDGVPDIATGLDCSVSPNIKLWLTGVSGLINSAPSSSYVTSGISVVMDSKFSDLNGDGIPDLATALKSELGNFKGGFEVFRGEGDASFSAMQYITEAGTAGSVDLGEVWALDTGDLDGDGDEDIVVGSHDNAISGHIDIYLNNGYGSFVWHSRYIAPGSVNDVKIVDMMEDDQQDLDIIAATSSSQTSGYIALWLNENCTFGLPDTTGHSFAPEETPRWPDDLVNAQGAALCLAALHANRDIFPDVVYGTRNSVFYSGDIFILQAYGTLPISGDKINKTSPGEIVTLDVADFNKDNRPDIAVGTRSSATQGKLIAYFGRDL